MDRVIPQFPFYILFLFPVTVPYGTKPVDRTQRSVESGSLLLVYRCRRVQFFVYMKKALSEESAQNAEKTGFEMGRPLSQGVPVNEPDL